MIRPFILSSLLITASLGQTGPTVTNVRSAQIPGTHKVRIEYDLATYAPCNIKILASFDGGANYGETPVFTAENVTAGNRLAGTVKSIDLDAKTVTSLRNQFTKQLRFKIVAAGGTVPPWLLHDISNEATTGI